MGLHRIAVLFLLLALGYPSSAQSSKSSANDLVRKIISNELKAEQQDHSHWMFRFDTQKPNAPEEVDEVVETKDGDLKYPVLLNDQPISQEERKRADDRIQQFVNHPEELRKSQKDKTDDEARSQQMLRLFPQAFLFQQVQQQGDLVELKFTPNPNFKPPTREARVFHAMEGNLWLNTKEARLVRIDGHLMHEVKFGGGILGHLDPGGQFHVKQEEVAPGFWELTALNVQMNGKALFFKTISVRQKYTRSNFKRVSDDLAVTKGVQMLRNQIATQQASLRH